MSEATSAPVPHLAVTSQSGNIVHEVTPAAPTTLPTPAITTAPAQLSEPTIPPELVTIPPATTTQAQVPELRPLSVESAQAAAPEPTITMLSESSVTDQPEVAGTDDQEPSSALTGFFSEFEWNALYELRGQLPEIFAEAFPDEPNARETPVKIWGVPIDPRNPKSDARVSVVLMKFLRARNLSVYEARVMLVSTLRWRKTFDIDSVLNEEFPQEIFGTVGAVYGRDKGGRPIVYNVFGHADLKAVFGDIQRFVRWRVALMERSVELLDFTEVDQTLQIHDYGGVSLTSRDTNSKNAANEATSIFQNYYPELLYKKFFVNVPTLLNWIFWAFKPLISANTLAKLAVVGTGHHAIGRALLPYIDANQLPTKYGGTAAPPPNHSTF